MDSPAVFKPDLAYFGAIALKAVRCAGVDPADVLIVSINCGNGAGLGQVVMKDGRVFNV
jgi:hypothetical protein